MMPDPETNNIETTNHPETDTEVPTTETLDIETPASETMVVENDAPQSSPASPPSPTAKWRLPLLVFNTILLGACTVWVATDPKVGKLQPYEFPEEVTLDGADFRESEPLNPVEKPEYEGSSYISGHHYQYRDRDQPVDIEVRYVIDTFGGVDKFTREHPHFAESERTTEIIAQIKLVSETGHYALIPHEDRMYISACINPRGNTTGTTEQYATNQVLYDTVLERVGSWMFGRDRWRDDRCLWTIMYSPIGDDPEQTTEQLEAHWEDWAEHWQANFPPI